MERFSIDSAVRGFHVYKDIWNPEIGEVLLCEQEFGNLHDPYAVPVVREDNVVVGHVPRTISALCYFFLRRNGMILCQVTGRRRRSVDLPQGGMEVPCTLTFVGQSQYIKKLQKLIALAPTKSIEPPPPKKVKAESLVIVEDEVEDEQTSTSGTNPQWLKFQGCLLMETDREAIVSDDLLNDRHINYAQTLLHYQFPLTEGLHNTLLQKKNRQQKIKCGIQIIHDRGNHWIVASTIDSDQSVQVYDSVYSTVNAKTVDVINNIFVITDETKIDLKRTQIQKGSQDCGLFAIAIATALLNGLDMSQITFCQEDMRQHLISCFTAKLLTPFPTTN